jgi:hypothetical protein
MFGGNLPPPAPTRGEFILDHIRDLVSWLRRNRILPGSGVTMSQTSNGITLSVSQEQEFEPFQISMGSGLSVTMEPGKLKAYGLTSEEYSDYTIYTDKSFFGTSTSISVSDNTTTEIWLEVYVSSYNVNGISVWQIVDSDSGAPYDSLGAVIETGSTVPTQTFQRSKFDDAPEVGFDYETIYLPIASVTAASGEVTDITQHRQGEIPLFLDASCPTYLISSNVGDIPYQSGTSVADMGNLLLGSEGSIMTAGTAGPQWTALGTQDSVLVAGANQPEWSSGQAVTVVVAIRDNAGTIEYKTRTINVISAGTESGWLTT